MTVATRSRQETANPQSIRQVEPRIIKDVNIRRRLREILEELETLETSLQELNH